MSGIDFSKLQEKPLVEKSYAEGLNDKFSKKSTFKKEKQATSIRHGKQVIEGWSITKDQELETEQEFLDSELIRMTSFLHARIKREQKFSNGEEISVQYFLDSEIPLQIKIEEAKTKDDLGLKDVFLYNGSTKVFDRSYYKNATYRETFFLEKESNPKEKYDLRFFTKKGELASENGISPVLEYKPRQMTFYPPEELKQIINEVASEKKIKNSTIINYAICGLLDVETRQLLNEKLEERNIISLFNKIN